MSELVLLLDDNHVMRQALRNLFESEPDFEVAGEAEHGQEAIGKAEELKPDLIVLDLSMPGMNGLEAAPILRNKVPAVILVLVTNYPSYAMAAPAREAGIHAVVPKNQAATHLMPTIRALLAGETRPPQAKRPLLKLGTETEIHIQPTRHSVVLLREGSCGPGSSRLLPIFCGVGLRAGNTTGSVPFSTSAAGVLVGQFV